MNFLNKMPDWLRWILFLPAAVIAMFVSYPIIYFVNKITIYFILGPSIAAWATLIIANYISSALFVFIGATVAPNKKLMVAVVLAVIYAFIGGASIMMKIYLGLEISLSLLQLSVGIISGIIGSICSVYALFDEENATG